MELSIVSYDRCDENLLEGFRRIYMEAFPDEDEREPYDEIKRRISSHSSTPGTLACILTDGGKVIGGLVSDYYVFPESGALDVEAIYVAIDASSRRNGFGRKLLDKGLSMTVSEAERLTGMELRNIYFETENPFEVKVESFDPVSRLKFFSSLGALRVPIEYRQPPLSGDTDWAANMFLMVLPSPGRHPSEYIYSHDLEDFLTAFYQGLSVTDSAAYEGFRRNIDTISEFENGTRGKKIVRLDSFGESVKYSLRDVSVLLHYRMSGGGFPKEAASDRPRSCPVFDSYECDLMDYAHQSYVDRPFRTYYIKSYEKVSLSLPRFYSFVSEGHTFYRIPSEDSINVSMSINCSSRGNSVPENERYIVSLVIHPADECSMNELSLIKLITAFGSRQECYRTYGIGSVSDLTVSDRTGKQSSLSDFVIGALSSTPEGELPAGTKLELCTNGAVELELSEVYDAGSQESVVKNYKSFYSSISSSSPDTTLINKTLCGIVLGIFDYERMNDAEIFDTVKPIVPRKSSFMVLCRGNLLKIRLDREGTERVENIFISPYVLIPDVALSFNEMVLASSQHKLAGIDADRPYKGNSKYGYFKKIRDDSKELQAVQDSLTNQYIHNCFNYVSEQQIFTAGQEKRGLDEKLSSLETSIKSKWLGIETRKSRYSLFIDTIQNIMLLILAILQVYTAVNGLHWLFITALILTLAVGADIAYKKLKS